MAPILVLAAPLMGQPKFQLAPVHQAEMWMLFGAVLLGAPVTTTGRSNPFKGAQLLALVHYRRDGSVSPPLPEAQGRAACCDSS